MRNQILENKEFNIISRSIDNATKCTVVDVSEDCFTVKLHNDCKYEKDESVELFTMTSKGQLYFETIVKDICGTNVSVWFPLSHKYLQRREFSRIQTEQEITLNYNGKNITAQVSDISAGGLKVITQEQLQLLEEYKISINIENKVVETIFEPIRIETSAKGFVSSGRFNNISNYDRIALVQYCFRKQIENSNK
ncbi:MAG: PilZ domain-containing protein [Candidatus Gastranaerophilales bacterium]|nr:PilZ domain-containing protein [Candidatus Gastranaerophilales bacterium]